MWKRRKTRIKILEKTLQKDIAGIEKYDAYTREFRDMIRVADNPAAKSKASYIDLHLKQIKRSKLSKKKKEKAIQNLVANTAASVAKLFAEDKENLRMKVSIDTLVELRESEKYRAMANSATKRGFVEDESDFFRRTVKEAIKVAELDKNIFLDKLNKALEKHGLDTVYII